MAEEATGRPRVALVLGAGGPVGHAYHAGVLHALEDSLGWDARGADLIIGTSAGAQVGALLRAGLRPAHLAARVHGEELPPAAQHVAKHFIRPSPAAVDPHLPFRLSPAAAGFLVRSIRRPSLASPGRLLSALLPEGRVRLDTQAAGFRKMFGEGWPERDLWITSVHLDSGDRTVFGSPGAPEIDVGTAVACSGAVPAIHVPMEWKGRRYVDGGVVSATHVELAQDYPHDLVIVSSPLSRYALTRQLLLRELKGFDPRSVVLFEPSPEVVNAMGFNPMATERAPAVARLAYESTARSLAGGFAREHLAHLR